MIIYLPSNGGSGINLSYARGENPHIYTANSSQKTGEKAKNVGIGGFFLEFFLFSKKYKNCHPELVSGSVITYR